MKPRCAASFRTHGLIPEAENEPIFTRSESLTGLECPITLTLNEKLSLTSEAVPHQHAFSRNGLSLTFNDRSAPSPHLRFELTSLTMMTTPRLYGDSRILARPSPT